MTLNLFGEPQCTRGWERRCGTARCTKCTCDCGGLNHGKAAKRIMENDEKKIIKEKANFFLTFYTECDQAHLGQEVVVLADFAGVPAGTHGHVVEIYELGRGKHKGVMIEWVDEKRPSWQKPLADGFATDELEYLAFGTIKHPTKAK